MSTAPRHSEDFGVLGAAIPEFQEDEIGGTESEVGRAHCAVVEDVFVEQSMKMIDRDAEHGSCFGFGKRVNLRLVQICHAICPLHNKVCTCFGGAGISAKLLRYSPL